MPKPNQKYYEDLTRISYRKNIFTLMSVVGRATFLKLEIFFKVTSGSDNGPAIKHRKNYK